MRWKIAPSILSADFARLGEQVRAAEEAGVEQIHVDVMDGHFVPNLSMGPIVVQALKRVTDVPLDVHLMITDPGSYLETFVEAGADHISFHVEVGGDARGMLDWLREKGVGRGIAINPETAIEPVLELLPHVDMVVVMTVHPGFGGQSFLGENLEKVRKVRQEEEKLRQHGHPDLDLDVEVDGGIDPKTIVQSRDAGANVFVAGSSIFAEADIESAIHELRRNLNPV
jgi:ribulose-phosphate 3-epimerase